MLWMWHLPAIRSQHWPSPSPGPATHLLQTLESKVFSLTRAFAPVLPSVWTILYQHTHMHTSTHVHMDMHKHTHPPPVKHIHRGTHTHTHTCHTHMHTQHREADRHSTQYVNSYLHTMNLIKFYIFWKAFSDLTL